MRNYLDSIIEDSSDNRIALVSRSPGEVRDGREGCPEAAHRANAHMRAGKTAELHTAHAHRCGNPKATPKPKVGRVGR